MRYDVLSNKMYCTIVQSNGVPDYLWNKAVRSVQHDLSHQEATDWIKSNMSAQEVVLDFQQFVTKICGEKEWTPGRAWLPTRKFGYISKYDNPNDVTELDKGKEELYPKNIRFNLDSRVKQPEPKE